jgi:hypothetical protein
LVEIAVDGRACRQRDIGSLVGGCGCRGFCLLFVVGSATGSATAPVSWVFAGRRPSSDIAVYLRIRFTRACVRMPN